MKILAIGDVVGSGAVAYLKEHLWKKRAELGVDFVIANGENASEIHGICTADAEAHFLDSQAFKQYFWLLSLCSSCHSLVDAGRDII